MDIITNPMFIAVSVGSLSYLYIYYSNKNSSNPEDRDKPISLTIPLIITIVTWILAYSFTHHLNTSSSTVDAANNVPIMPVIDGGSIQGAIIGNNVVHDLSTDSIHSFQLINKSISMPNKMPEVFIENY